MSTFDPRMPSKTAIIKKKIHLLHANVVNRDIFPQRTIISADRKRKKNSHKCTSLLFHRNTSSMGPRTDQFLFVFVLFFVLFSCKERCDTCRHSKETTVLVSPWDGRHWTIKQHITSSSPNTVYVVMCEVHNDWYVGSTTDMKARWRNHKSGAKLKKSDKMWGG